MPAGDRSDSVEIKFRVSSHPKSTPESANESRETTLTVDIRPENDEATNISLTGDRVENTEASDGDGSDQGASRGNTSKANEALCTVQQLYPPSDGTKAGVLGVVDVEDNLRDQFLESWTELKAADAAGFEGAFTRFLDHLTTLVQKGDGSALTNALVTAARALQAHVNAAEKAGAIATSQELHTQFTHATAKSVKDALDAAAGAATPWDDNGDTNTDGPYSVDDDRFEVVEENGNWVLRAKEGADLVEGAYYTVIVTYTDAQGDSSYSESFKILKGGVYMEAGGQSGPESTSGQRHYDGHTDQLIENKGGILAEDYGHVQRDGKNTGDAGDVDQRTFLIEAGDRGLPAIANAVAGVTDVRVSVAIDATLDTEFVAALEISGSPAAPVVTLTLSAQTLVLFNDHFAKLFAPDDGVAGPGMTVPMPPKSPWQTTSTP